jgi:DNA-directed RNA polymerase subunit M/transcription elongation factor TFIIS
VTNSHTTAPDQAERLRYVFIERPRCPRCGSAALVTIRTETTGDESLTRRTRCRECQHVFFIIWE